MNRALLATLLLANAALADDRALPESVTLVLPSCTELPFDGTDFVSFAGVELRAVGVSRVSAAPPGSDGSTQILVGASCDPNVAQVSLAIAGASGIAAAERTVDLGDVSRELRARALAIAVVELLRTTQASDPIAAAAPAGVPASAPPSPAPVFVAVPTAPPRGPDHRSEIQANPRTSGHVEVGVTIVGFPSTGTALVGPAAGYVLDVGSLRLSAGGLIMFGGAEVSAGSADLHWASGYVAAGFQGKGTLRPLIEPRFYAGYSWASGNPAGGRAIDGSSAGHLVAIPVLAAGVRGNIAERWEMLTDVEIGYALGGVTYLADDQRVAGMSKMLLGAKIGVAFTP